MQEHEDMLRRAANKSVLVVRKPLQDAAGWALIEISSLRQIVESRTKSMHDYRDECKRLQEENEKLNNFKNDWNKLNEDYQKLFKHAADTEIERNKLKNVVAQLEKLFTSLD